MKWFRKMKYINQETDFFVSNIEARVIRVADHEAIKFTYESIGNKYPPVSVVMPLHSFLEMSMNLQVGLLMENMENE